MKKEKMEIQDCGTKDVPSDHIFYYHTHGTRQGMGTCKLHSTQYCSVLVNWKPGKGLGKVIMRDHDKLESIPEQMKCKKCWKNKK